MAIDATNPKTWPTFTIEQGVQIASRDPAELAKLTTTLREQVQALVRQQPGVVLVGLPNKITVAHQHGDFEIKYGRSR